MNHDLNVYYAHQFVQNEPTNKDEGKAINSVYAPLEHKPILPETVTGSIYVEGVRIQTFIEKIGGEGQFTLNMSGPTPSCYATAVTIDHETGELEVDWNSPPGLNHLIVSYEYDAYIPKAKKPSDSPQWFVSYKVRNVDLSDKSGCPYGKWISCNRVIDKHPIEMLHELNIDSSKCQAILLFYDKIPTHVVEKSPVGLMYAYTS